MYWKKVIFIMGEDVIKIIDSVIHDFMFDMYEILDKVEDIEEEFNGYFYDVFMDILIENEVKSAVVLYGNTPYFCRNGDEFLKLAKRMGVDWRSMLRQALRRSEEE